MFIKLYIGSKKLLVRLKFNNNNNSMIHNGNKIIIQKGMFNVGVTGAYGSVFGGFWGGGIF